MHQIMQQIDFLYGHFGFKPQNVTKALGKDVHLLLFEDWEDTKDSFETLLF